MRLETSNVIPSGLWKSRGYGWLLRVDESGYALFDYTEVSCVEFERGTRAELERGFDRIRCDGETLSMHVAGDITRYTFDRTTRSPTPVVSLDAPRISDPVFNFDVLWRTFWQDYAFFARHGVDWQKTRERYRPHVSRQSDDAALREAFEAMLTELHDNHVYLKTPRSSFVSDRIADIKRWMVDAFA